MTSRPAHRLADGHWRWAELAIWALPLVAYLLLPDYLALGGQLFIMALFALSLDLVLGYAGILSLGHAAYFGVGAYTAGLLASHGWNEPISGLLLAGMAATLVGWLASLLVVRSRELAQLIVTLGIGLALGEAANRAAFLTGGFDGISGIAMAPLLGQFDFDLAGRTAYLYSLAVLMAVFVLVRRLVHSPFGLGLRALRCGPARLPAIGVDVRRWQMAAFTLGAGIAGLAGALLTQTTQFVGLDSISFQRSAELLIVLVLGGAGRLYGGLVGAVAFVLAQNAFASLDPVYWQFWLGLLLVVVVMFARGGILGGLAAIERRQEDRPR